MQKHEKVDLTNCEVLIVDDLLENIKVLGNILKINNYKISIAMSAQEALAYLRQKLPDLILLDVNMPEMNGFEFCEQIKKEERTANIPVIFLTAKVATEDIITGFEVGGVDYITKPYNSIELLARVEAHLELKKSRDLIIQQNEKLEELNESKNKFFSLMAHDIRNPVSGIYLYTEVVKENFSKMPDNKKEESILVLNQSSKQLMDLVEQLLEWARIQMDKTEFHPAKIKLKQEVNQLFLFLNQMADAKKIKLQENINQEVSVFADLNMLHSIINNLVSNAIKFSHEGGLVKVEYTDNGSYSLIQVIDNGVGMSQEAKDKLFRLDTHHGTRGTANEKGTGLGLLLSKEFVKKHGGEILVESQLGKGTTFSFTLPKE